MLVAGSLVKFYSHYFLVLFLRFDKLKKILIKLYEEVLFITYEGCDCRNQSDKTNNPYECQILNVLEEFGFNLITIQQLFAIEHPEYSSVKHGAPRFQAFKKELQAGTLRLRNHKGLSCLYQPFGSQEKPDFIPIDGKVYMLLEAKSAKGGKIVTNSGIATGNQVFVCATGKGIFSFLGKQYFTPEFKAIINTLQEKIKRLEKKANKELAALHLEGKNEFGLTHYYRKMIQQGKALVDHRDDVRKYIKGLYE